MERLKKKLKAGRDSCLLFNTPLLVRELETAYRGMWDDYRRGALPKPDLRNMDVYHEIGVNLYTDDAARFADVSVEQRYRKELENWNESWPLLPDTRLWQK